MAGLSSHAVFRVVTTAAAACAMSCLGGKRLSMPYEMHGDMVESEKMALNTCLICALCISLQYQNDIIGQRMHNH